jgi:cohesin complex subunit SCC1
MSSTNQLLYGDGPLASAWLAASLEKKLSKQQYLKTSIVQSTRAIEYSSEFNNNNNTTLVSGESDSQLQFPTQSEIKSENNINNVKEGQEPITLRISGQLLYGVIKIYSRKTRYLYDDVSLALIQLKSAFAISKSITLPIEDTVVSSLDQITLKDKITEANVLYDTQAFDITKIFGGSNAVSSTNTQVWTNSDSVVDSNDYALGDISVGRNNFHDSEVTDNATTMSIPDFGDRFLDDNAHEAHDAANISIDALARRAVPPLDDLDEVEDFELPLDLDLKKNPGNESNEVAGISDYQLAAVDNMDLEFTIDEVHDNGFDAMGTANNTFNELEPNTDNEKEEEEEEEEEEDDHDDEEELEVIQKRKVKRKSVQKQQQYINTHVVRTHRKRLIVDETNVIPTDVLKKNQREYPLRLHGEQNKETVIQSNESYDLIINSLKPRFLNAIGSSWKSIKRRRLIDSSDTFEEIDSPMIETAAIEGEIPAFSTMNEFTDSINHTDESLPNVDADDLPPADYELNFEDDRHTAPLPELAQPEESLEDMIEENNEVEDFDNHYEEMRTKNKTTIEVAQELRNVFADEKTTIVSFDAIVDTCKLSENKKSSATRTFFELLVLGTENTISLKQDRLFGDIIIQSKDELSNKFL